MDEDLAMIRGWLKLIGETDPDIVREIVARCREIPAARALFVRMAKADQPAGEHDDERRTCLECKWLSWERERFCRVADKRRRQMADGHEVQGEFPTWSYHPVLTIQRRCEFFHQLVI